MIDWTTSKIAGALLALAIFIPNHSQAGCFDESAQYHKVNPWILRAIAAQESGFKAATLAYNTNGTVDRGMMGINSVHLPELARYGIAAHDLLDGCKSVYLAGWRLRKMIDEFGNTWEAVGAYHSKTPSKRDRYAAKIQHIVGIWQSQGIIPP
jgi:soluble lytic murein transglycosylase-like protein